MDQNAFLRYLRSPESRDVFKASPWGRVVKIDGPRVEAVGIDGSEWTTDDDGETWTWELRSNEPRRHPRDPGIQPSTEDFLRRARQ